MKVTILGTGYVGLTTGVCLAYLCHHVTCLDPVKEKIDALREGRIPIFEPGLQALLAEASSRLRFTTCYEEAVPGAQVVFAESARVQALDQCLVLPPIGLQEPAAHRREQRVERK